MLKKIISIICIISVLLSAAQISVTAYDLQNEAGDYEECSDDKGILIVVDNSLYNNSTMKSKSLDTLQNVNNFLQSNNSGLNYIGYIDSAEIIFTCEETIRNSIQSYNNSTTVRNADSKGQSIIKLALNEAGSLHINEMLESLNKSNNIISAERNHVVQAEPIESESLEQILNVNTNSASDTASYDNSSVVSVNDAYYSNQYAIPTIQANKAWVITKGSKTVKVGVVDSGINKYQLDLSDQVDENLSKSFVPNVTPFTDGNGHGTHVAGIIGAVTNNNAGVAGICWDISIVSLKCLRLDGKGYSSDIISAIEYAKNNGISILNCSLGAKKEAHDDEVYNAMETAIRNYPGLIVAACGNSGTDALHYPAAYNLPNIISVASTDQNDNLATRSTYGSTVDLAAPGVDIYSTGHLGYHVYKSGTSMAAPYVTATAALIRSILPSASTTTVKNYILNNVDILPSLQGKVNTGGRLNTFAAVCNAAGYIIADVNFDGSVTSADARLVLRFSSKLESFSQLQRALADVNNDGIVTAADSRIILQMAANLV